VANKEYMVSIKGGMGVYSFWGHSGRPSLNELRKSLASFFLDNGLKDESTIKENERGYFDFNSITVTTSFGKI
jgi:hypothetical protein